MKINHDTECECGLCKIFKMNLETLQANKDARNQKRYNTKKESYANK